MSQEVQQDINIYLFGEVEEAFPHIKQIRDDLPEMVRNTIKDATVDAAYHPVPFHVTSFNLGWYTNHIIMLRPQSGVGTVDFFREQFGKIRHFIRNQDYKNPVVINVFADTLPIEVEEIEAVVMDVLADVPDIHTEIIDTL